jgi:hypothetical protein
MDNKQDSQEGLPNRRIGGGTNETPNEGFPTRRIGGGSNLVPSPTRGTSKECHAFMALTPDGLVKTTNVSPTLFFYIPELTSPDKTELEFVLLDEQKQEVYKTSFKPTGEPEILRIKLPDSPPILKLNQNYHWYFSNIVDGKKPANDEVLKGWIRREPISPNLANQIAQFKDKPLEQQVKLYQEANLWQESLTLLDWLKRAYPDNQGFSKLWNQLINSVGLKSCEPNQ